MPESLRIQGRDLRPGDIKQIRDLIAAHPDWSRRRLSEVLARAWDWRNGRGLLKDMAARSLMLKLEQHGWIQLPARRQIPSNRMGLDCPPVIEVDSTPISAALSALQPLSLVRVDQDPSQRALFSSLLARYHYLGFRGAVGENLGYLAYDTNGRLLACLLFGAPAWTVAARDRFIGWDTEARRAHLGLVINNSRFLILPWVKVAHLASHLLGRIARRISADAEQRYGHPLYLLETFVEQGRFAGTCYQAANWQAVGATRGRSRNDRDGNTRVPVKETFLYPLRADFRRRLGVDNGRG